MWNVLLANTSTWSKHTSHQFSICIKCIQASENIIHIVSICHSHFINILFISHPYLIVFIHMFIDIVSNCIHMLSMFEISFSLVFPVFFPARRWCGCRLGPSLRGTSGDFGLDYRTGCWYGREGGGCLLIPSILEWDLTNGPLSKLLEVLDTQV